MRHALVVLAAGAVTVAALGGCTSPEPRHTDPPRDADGPDAAFIDAGPDGVSIVEGDDWTLPSWVRPAPNSGFFSEDESVPDRILTRSVDFSWRQLQPSDGPIDKQREGEAQGLYFSSWNAQLEGPGTEGAYWMRIFASGVDWAPEWVAEDCGVHGYGPDYDGEDHLPIWDECVWGHLMDTYRRVFVDEGLAADPRLRFVYVPGAFTWAEYDYETINAAVDAGELDLETYLSWYGHAWSDLIALFGDNAHKLVFTGEDYPFGPFGEDDDLLAAQAAAQGMGIRTGITELSNFHLSEAPAYGSHVQPDGHLVIDESVRDARLVYATENECFTDCGYRTDDPYYAVRQSNLKALQLRMNWIYVVPGPSYLAQYPEHWDWVRLSMGQTPESSADAWAELRDASDTYWADDGAGEGAGRFEDPATWRDRPFVRNLERWLVQVDEPGSVAHRTDVDVHEGVLEPENGIAYEGLSTDVAAGDTGFVFEVDERFAEAAASSRLVLKVTYRDTGTGDFTVDAGAASSAPVTRAGDGRDRTATIALPEGALEGEHRIRISLAGGADDLIVRFVRLVRVEG
ncbi:MAG: hypothetical protein KF727_10430 [Microbacteriaceae bacterium]|nr:hypothetical protein [Microbacteriaceae bacterium]